MTFSSEKAVILASAIPYDIDAAQGVDMLSQQVGDYARPEIMENLGSPSDLYENEYELLAARIGRRRSRIFKRASIRSSAAENKSDDEESEDNQVSSKDKRAHANLPAVLPALG
ncbi:hypothetical protein AYI70_g5639 [Smittium culicis]|uniref:Uncharacterized protein n=1 Tax=Smittium culicis TaxID=133412 RepID=A0A1R1XTN8_9FUNG|nr:hypothetical protein AYI70_g5639 [Smittium culicis]